MGNTKIWFATLLSALLVLGCGDDDGGDPAENAAENVVESTEELEGLADDPSDTGALGDLAALGGQVLGLLGAAPDPVDPPALIVKGPPPPACPGSSDNPAQYNSCVVGDATLTGQISSSEDEGTVSLDIGAIPPPSLNPAAPRTAPLPSYFEIDVNNGTSFDMSGTLEFDPEYIYGHLDYILELDIDIPEIPIRGETIPTINVCVWYDLELDEDGCPDGGYVIVEPDCFGGLELQPRGLSLFDCVMVEYDGCNNLTVTSDEPGNCNVK